MSSLISLPEGKTPPTQTLFKLGFYLKTPASVIALGILAVGSVSNASELRFGKGQSAVTLAGEGIKIADAHPRVQVLLGDQKKLIDWVPENAGKVSQEKHTAPLGKGETTVVAWEHPEGFTFRWKITELHERDGYLVRCELVNTGEQNLRLRRFNVLEAETGSLTVDGDWIDWMTGSRYLKYARYYDTLADLRERGQLTQDRSGRAKDTRDVPYEEDFTLYTDDGKRGMSISPIGDVTWLWTNLQVPQDGRLGIDVTSEMTGVLVEPGETRQSELVLVSFGSWRDANQNVIDGLRHTFQPRDTPPVYGWCSWYCAGAHVRQDHCFDTAEFVAGNRDRYPCEVLQVDEGWSIGRHRWNSNAKFDRGMEALADAFANAGTMPGVWLCPATPNSQRVIDGKVVHTGGQGGSSYRAFDPSWYVGHRIGQRTNSIDPTSPGGREYMQGELRRLYDQGYRYFKTDFSRVADVESGYHDPKKTYFEVQRELYGQWREAIGEDSYLLACNSGPVRAVLGLADAVRVGTDSNQKWSFCYPPNKYGKPDDVHGSWFPILQLGAASAYTHLIACDPDVSRVDDLGNLYFDPRFEGEKREATHYQSMATVQTFHGIQALYGGTMMVSDMIYKPHYQEGNRLRMLEIMHPVTPDKGFNFGGGSDMNNSQFGFVAERSWGKWISMVTWNPDHEGKRDLKIHLAPIEAIGTEKFHLWSYWEEKYLGIQDKSYVTKDVPKYHSRLLRLTPVEDGTNDAPILIGSNLHMAMGSAEVLEIDYTPNGIVVELEPSAGALEGQLVFHAKQGLRVSSATGCQAFVVQDDNDEQVFAAIITGRQRGEAQRIEFEFTAAEVPRLSDIKKNQDLRAKWESGSILALSKRD